MDTVDGDGPKRNAKSIEVKNVRYVDKDLVNDVNLHCTAYWCRCIQGEWFLLIPEEERLKMLQDYLADATHPFIRVADC